MKKVVFLNSHPIQYFAPLYKTISEKTDWSLETLFCSKHGLKGEKDPEFGVKVKWDIPVLEGYEHRFLQNHSLKPGLDGFLGLLNIGVIPYLFKLPKSIIVVHGWGYFTNVLTLIIARLAGHVVCLRGESPMSHEAVRSASALRKRDFFFKNLLFKIPHYFLFIGSENKAFYKNYGVKESQLFFAPYCVDNTRFSSESKKYEGAKSELKRALNLPSDKRIILFSGKYIDKKRPMDLLKAFHNCEYKEKGYLVFMGDGEQRQEMTSFIQENEMTNVLLTGFVNQSKVPMYYAVADVFVMCSKEGETWGLSTNEAMNFSLPVLLSSLTGSSSDLVEEGKNGWRFETYDIAGMTKKLDLFFEKSEEELQQMGVSSKSLIKGYSYDQVIAGLEAVYLKHNKIEGLKLGVGN